ncbi:hypothetical protein [Nocardia farcinica]|uniref:hypothetical protein n=1 Tax=Nocardia farcinica TaxID=37329 RepID=UPI00245466C0|nr:hypothetical protein [Nocardia farcinica]
MKRDRPTADEVRRAFDAELANSLTGAGPRTDSGLSPQVEDLLWDIADAHPAVPDSLLDAPRAAVDQQVHAKE